jgi:DNA-binding transcriptional LysR family regulator
MELRQLEYFLAVAEEGNFTRAALRVHISQSGVSAQIRQLEHEVGAALLDRSGRAVTLTTAGAAALEHARAVLGSVTAMQHAVDDVTNVIRGRLVVGMVTGCTITPLFDALGSFHISHPGVEIALTEDTSDQLIGAVRAGAADLALIGAAGTPPTGMEALLIVSERLVAAVPIGHPLARRRSATLADVVAYPVVCMPAGTGIRTVFDQACAAHGIQPTIALEASAPAAVADLAIRGFGIAILSASMTGGYEGRLRAVVLSDVDTPAVLALIWKPAASPALRGLLRHTSEAFTTSHTRQPSRVRKQAAR